MTDNNINRLKNSVLNHELNKVENGVKLYYISDTLSGLTPKSMTSYSFMNNKLTKKYIMHIAESYDVPYEYLYHISQGGGSNIQGTWLCKPLVYFFFSKISEAYFTNDLLKNAVNNGYGLYGD